MKNKKFLAMILALIMVVAIAGCGAKADKKETGTKDNSTKVESSVKEKDDVEDVKDESEKVSGEVLDETVKTEDVVVDTENKTDSTDKKDGTTSNKNETSKKEENAGTTTKPSTDNTQKPSVGNSNNNNSSTTQKPSNNNNSSSNTNNNSNNQNTTKPDASTTTQPSTPVHEHSWTEVTEEKVTYYAWRTICGKCKMDLTDLSAEDKIYHSAVVCCNGYSVQFVEVDYVTENIQRESIVTGYKCSCGATK